MDTCNPFQPYLAPAMAWMSLWPQGSDYKGQGWTESLSPGVSLLLDESGDEAVRWMPLMAGAQVPGQGRLHCNGIDSQHAGAEFRSNVYWHHPRSAPPPREWTAQNWLQSVAQQWPSWSDIDCARHCVGFDLMEHLHKPMWQLSTGTQRKLGLTAALACGARLTLIEEPIAGLDRDSIRYLSQALDQLVEKLAQPCHAPRWVLVAHWELLAQVMWDEVLALPSVGSLGAGTAWQEGDGHRQQSLHLEQ